MKRIFLVLVTLIWCSAAHAQSARLTVTKQVKKNFRTTSSSGSDYRHLSGTETYVYTVEVVNRSAGALNNLKVKWAVIVRTYSEEKLVSGERTGSVGLGQKLTFETDPIDLSVYKYESGSGYSSRSGSDVRGYSVQVFNDGKLIAEENMPASIGPRIEELRQAERKPRHRF